jgi:DNA-binding LytR/AlgR family response regulator
MQQPAATPGIYSGTRSFLVNMNYIRSIGTMDMCLHNGTNIPLAQRRVADIKKHYLAFQMEE